MKTSTPTAPKVREPRSVLLIGPPGSRKTTLLLQFPGVYVADCDRNLDGPEFYLRTKAKMDLNYGYDCISMTDDDPPVPVPIQDCFDRLMIKLTKVKDHPEIKTVCVDSLTLINEFIIRKVLDDKKSSEMEARHWQPFKTKCYELLVSKLRSLGKDVIVTAHETDIERTDPKNVMQKVLIQRRPYIQGGINEQVGGLFTDMWRMDIQPAPGGVLETNLYTVRTTYDELKNTIGLPDVIKNPTYESIKKYWEAR